jgi:4-methylaminobutanoate oxidase (formaldehyde-forming)
MHWSPAIGAEAMATRQAAAIFDETSFSKIEIAGPGALGFLQRLCDNDMDRAVGRVTYTQMLNRRGGIECDFTVTRLAEDRFWIVTGTAFGNHDLGWIRSHAPVDGSVQVRDLTAARACLGIWGPAAREIVGSLTDDDISNDAFPYMTAREISIGHVPVLALRVTYVGELGWELYCPTEYGLGLWDALWRAGQPHGLAAGGYRAIDSLRLEKGYRVWSSDITPEDTPYQAGLGFAVRLGKADGFIGREALVEAGTEPDRRLRCLVLDDPLMVALGNEPIRIAGAVVGRITSGGYGYAVARSIAYAYLPGGMADVGRRLEVVISGEWVGGEVAAEPLYDPDGERVRS